MKTVTVVYEVVDEAEWQKRNPLHYAHDGLKAVRVGMGDALEDRDAMSAVAEIVQSLETLGIDSESLLERVRADLERGLEGSARSQLAFVDRLRAAWSERGGV